LLIIISIGTKKPIAIIVAKPAKITVLIVSGDCGVVASDHAGSSINFRNIITIYREASSLINIFRFS